MEVNTSKSPDRPPYPSTRPPNFSLMELLFPQRLGNLQDVNAGTRGGLSNIGLQSRLDCMPLELKLVPLLLEPPPLELEPPSLDLEPPSLDLEPPFLDLEPPPLVLEPPPL